LSGTKDVSMPSRALFDSDFSWDEDLKALHIGFNALTGYIFDSVAPATPSLRAVSAELKLLSMGAQRTCPMPSRALTDSDMGDLCDHYLAQGCFNALTGFI
jgi:hypothetical protein